ncbi:hypothetical protein ACJMK2_028660 [Sinanodonta woodiana]|uniref:Uncharacterized protein n=1 Tax=Sinanodonta woodiana TaxID=1069815 RepID=A0ABD3X7S9_SINWO
MDQAGIACITEHDALQATCLNGYCVELGIIIMVDQNGPLDDNEPMNIWIWHHLGKGNIRILPSYLVSKIRDTFPDPLSYYVLF